MSRPGEERPTDELLLPVVGAVLFASGEPVRPEEIAQALGLSAEEVEGVAGNLERLLERSESGLLLERVAGGLRLATRLDVGPWVRRFMQQRNLTRLSAAALETLAIVAYRQPITAPEIQAIRGRDPAASLKTLLDRKLLRILGRKKVVGSPLLYGTARQFLLHFGLNSLEDLPSIEEFEALAEGLVEAVPLEAVEPLAPAEESQGS
jgi:segregation and condensation protein B